MFALLEPALPPTITDEEGAVWRLAGLNPRFRFCRYLAGQYFARHRDGAHHEGPNRRSFRTVMAYLNEAPAFAGGATRFYDGKKNAAQRFSVAPGARLRPRVQPPLVARRRGGRGG